MSSINRTRRRLAGAKRRSHPRRRTIRRATARLAGVDYSPKYDNDAAPRWRRRRLSTNNYR